MIQPACLLISNPLDFSLSKVYSATSLKREGLQMWGEATLRALSPQPVSPSMCRTLNSQVGLEIRGFWLRIARRSPVFSILLCLFASLLSPALQAQSPKPPTLSSNRFLCVFDLSKPMHRQDVAV